MLEDTIEDRLDKAGGLLSDSEKTEGDAKEGELDENKVFICILAYKLFSFCKLQICAVFMVQKKSAEGGKQGGPLKKLKKDKVGAAAGKGAKGEGDKSATAPRVKPELTLPTMYVFFFVKFLYLLFFIDFFYCLRPTDVENSILEDLRNRVQLSNTTLPSVCFYTFINTHNGYV